MKTVNTIFYIIGKSCTGKNTIYERLINEIKFLEPIIPYTTRPKRSNEIDRKDYHFITNKEFFEFKRQSKVMEYRQYYNATNDRIWIYATIDDNNIFNKNDGKNHYYVTIGTAESFYNMQKYCEANLYNETTIRISLMYLWVEENLRLQRAYDRECSLEHPDFKELFRRNISDNADYNESILNQLENAHLISSALYYNYNEFENNDLNKCCAAIAQEIEETYLKNEERVVYENS